MLFKAERGFHHLPTAILSCSSDLPPRPCSTWSNKPLFFPLLLGLVSFLALLHHLGTYLRF